MGSFHGAWLHVVHSDGVEVDVLVKLAVYFLFERSLAGENWPFGAIPDVNSI